MLKLREYQKQAVNACLDSKGNFLVVLPTGTGKTEIFIELTKQLIKKDQKIIVIIDKIELLKQTIRRFECASIDFEVYHGKIKPKQLKKHVLITTVRTLYNSDCDLSSFKHVIVDEVHHITATLSKKSEKECTFKDLSEQNYKGCNTVLEMTDKEETETIFINEEIKTTILEKLLKRLNKKVYGFTATPIVDDVISCKGKFSIYDLLLKEKQCICSSKIFNHENVYYKSISYMIKRNYLCDFNIESWEVDTNNIFGIDNFKSVNYENLFKEEAKDVLIKLLKNVVNNYAENKTLIFLPDIQKIKYVRTLLIDLYPQLKNHINIIHEKTEKNNQDEIIKQFKDNKSKCKIILNCMKLTEGFDSPNISRVFILRACRSIRLFIQIIGRALRLDINNSKKIAKIYDYSLFAKEYHNKYLKHTDFNYKDCYTHCLTFLNDISCTKYKYLEIPQIMQRKESKIDEEIEYIFNKPRVKYSNTFNIETVECLGIKERYRIDFNYIPTKFLDNKEKYYSLVYNLKNDIFLIPFNDYLSFNIFTLNNKYGHREYFSIFFDYKIESIYFIYTNKNKIYMDKTKIESKSQLNSIFNLDFIYLFFQKDFSILEGNKFYKREITSTNIKNLSDYSKGCKEQDNYYITPLNNYFAKKIIEFINSPFNKKIIKRLTS